MEQLIHGYSWCSTRVVIRLIIYNLCMLPLSSIIWKHAMNLYSYVYYLTVSLHQASETNQLKHALNVDSARSIGIEGTHSSLLK